MTGKTRADSVVSYASDVRHYAGPLWPPCTRPWLLWAPSPPCWARLLGGRPMAVRAGSRGQSRSRGQSPQLGCPCAAAEAGSSISRVGCRLAMVHLDLHLVAFDGRVLADDGQDLVPERLDQLGSARHGPLVREQDLEPVPRG